MLKIHRHHNPALKSIHQVPLIHAWICPVHPNFPLHEMRKITYNYHLVVEEDKQLTMHTLSHKPINWEQGIPWGIHHIKAPQVWNKTTGHRTHIGVIDTGVDFQHPDLRHSLMRGVNFVQQKILPYDDNGHGTHIAGTIAAANQLYGIVGVAPRALIYPVKAFDKNGAAYVSDIIRGIDWCVQQGVDIINMSFGMKIRSKSLFQAVVNAYNAGVIIVASSGNDAKRKTIDYPARYLQTIAVGAANRNQKIASFSNSGRYVDIYAPGEKIISSWLKGNYQEMSGTSMATSHVSGAIALLLAIKPTLKPQEIKSLLRSTSLQGQRNMPRNYRELNVLRLLQQATP